MNSVWNDAARRDLRARLARLTPATPARWGTFDAPRAVAHLVEAARMAHGDVQVVYRHTDHHLRQFGV